MSDSSKPSPPRPAASVVLVRERAGGAVEVYLQRRHRKASFMSNAFVFPGGAADAGEDDLRVTAARELFEEAGVLLARAADGAALDAPAEALARWRGELDAGRCSLDDVLAGLDARLDLDALRYFAHWITPSIERKRFSAQFFVAPMPPAQTPTPDRAEMIDEIWVTPAEALARAEALWLPPPQLRIFLDLRDAAEAGTDALWAVVEANAGHRHPILPRLSRRASAPTLLLPWDPDYLAAGAGEALEMPEDHPLAVGPSRFVREKDTWKHIDAASSPSAE